MEASKSALTDKIGLSRSTLYYKRLQPEKDWLTKIEIEKVLRTHHSYGHKRIARELNINKKRVLRVMKIYGIKPYRRRRKPRDKAEKKEESIAYPNLLLDKVIYPSYPNHIWATDFTYLSFNGKFIYLATVLDLFTREIVGFNVLNRHDISLVSNALIHGLSDRNTPEILHSDRGSEYKSKSYTCLAENLNIKISMSHPGCPWENGYQESFYSHFKVDLGDPSRFIHLGQLVYAVYKTIHIYNHKRIHSSLKMAPAEYAKRFKGRTLSDVQFSV